MCSFKTKTASQSRSKGAKQVSADNLKRMEQVETLLKDCLTIMEQVARPQQLYEACKYLALLKTIKMYIGCCEADEEISTALLLGMFLNVFLPLATHIFGIESTKGLSLRRERGLVSCKPTLDVKGPYWPAEDILGSDITPSFISQDGEMDIEEIRSKMNTLLPPSWVTCSLTYDADLEHLYIVRYEKDYDPLILRLPLRRQASREDNTQIMCHKEAMDELENILATSDVVTKRGSVDMSRNDKMKWWDEREALDQRLMELLQRMETLWLGAFKV